MDKIDAIVRAYEQTAQAVIYGGISLPEAQLAAVLRLWGIDGWIQQRQFGDYFVDFYFPLGKLVVEIDGKEFHDAERDSLRDAKLLEHELVEKVLRIKAKHVLFDAGMCLEGIGAALAGLSDHNVNAVFERIERRRFERFDLDWHAFLSTRNGDDDEPLSDEDFDGIRRPGR